MGRLAADPQLRSTGSGIPVATVRLATHDRDKPEFHDVVLWTQLAEFVASYMTKVVLRSMSSHVKMATKDSAMALTPLYVKTARGLC